MFGHFHLLESFVRTIAGITSDGKINSLKENMNIHIVNEFENDKCRSELNKNDNFYMHGVIYVKFGFTIPVSVQSITNDKCVANKQVTSQV